MNITPIQAITPDISPYIKAVSQPKEIDQTSFYRSAMITTVLGNVHNFLEQTAALKEQADYNEAHAGYSANVSIAAAERMRQRVNAKGEPAYTTLATDVDKIAQDLGAKYLKNLSGAYADKFKNDILTVRGQLALKSYTETRKQQDEYIESALQDSLKEIMDAAVADDSQNIEQHVADYAQVIAGAVGTGYISEPTGKKLIAQAREEMIYNNFMKEAVRNAEALKPLILESSARELGISQQHYNTLNTYINRRIHENEIEVNTRQNLMASNIHLAIGKTNQLENLISEDDIKKLKEAGAISSLQANDLELQRFNREQKIVASIEKMRRSKSPNVLENPMLGEEEKRIIYNAALEQRIEVAKEAKGGEPLTDQELFQLNVDTTLTLPFACREMANLLTQGTKNASSDAYADAVLLAYTQLKAKCRNPTLGQLGVETSAVLAMCSSMKGIHSDISSLNALNLARQVVASTANDPQLQMHNRSRLGSKEVREKLYGKADDLEKGLNKFLLEAFDLDSDWYNPFSWFGGTINSSNRDIFELKQALDNFYVLTGDEVAARRAASTTVLSYWGVQPLAGKKVVMSYPPSQYLGNVTTKFKHTREGASKYEAMKSIGSALTGTDLLTDFEKEVPIDVDYDFEQFIEAQKAFMPLEDHREEFSLQADQITKEMAEVAGSPITWQVVIRRKDSKRFSIYLDPQGNTLRYPLYTSKGKVKQQK